MPTIPPRFTPDQTLTLHQDAVTRLLQQDNGDATLLYLYLAQSNDGFPSGWSIERCRQAQAMLQTISLLPSDYQKDNPKPDHVTAPVDNSPPVYDTTAVVEEMTNPKSEFPAFLLQMEEQFGRSFSPNDTNIVLDIYYNYHLSIDVLLMLITYCINKQLEQKSSRRRPTLNQVRSEAQKWQRMHLLTLEAAHEFVEKEPLRNKEEQFILQTFQLDAKELSPSMWSYVTQWKEWGFPVDTYAIAFDRCMTQLNKFTWNYTNGIFKNWKEKNLMTKSAIETYGHHFHASKPQYQTKAAVTKGVYAHETTLASPTTAPPKEVSESLERSLSAAKLLAQQFTPPT